MKKNGFMIVECIVASVVVLTSIILLYSQVKSIGRSYNKSFNYDNVTSMYALSNFRSFLMKDDNYDLLLNEYKKNLEDETKKNSCAKYFVNIDCSWFVNSINGVKSTAAVTYCDNLVKAMGITPKGNKPLQFIFTSSKLELKDCVDDTNLKSSFIDYIKTIKKETDESKYMLIASFNDNTTASILVYRASEVQNG